MRQQKLSRSTRFRSAMIPIVLLCLTASACSDEQPAGLKASSPVARTSSSIPFNRFFTAWSRTYTSGAIQTQTFGLDVRQERQFVNWYVDQQTLAFARANPGRLYIDGDEPDQYCATWSAYDYAGIYHDFAVAIRGADPTARLSPAGFVFLFSRKFEISDLCVVSTCLIKITRIKTTYPFTARNTASAHQGRLKKGSIAK